MNRYTVGAGITTLSLFGLFGKSKTETKVENVPAVSNGGSRAPARTPAELRINPSEYFVKYGYPGPVHDVSTNQEFISCYNRALRNPYWVVEHINRDSIKSVEGVDRKKSFFKEDEKIPPEFRALLRDYFKSGYDRGHQAPAADAKFNQLAMNETFSMSNISPQVGDGFNRDYWAHFEDFCRRLTQKYDSVRIITGPLYLPKKFPDGKYRIVVEMIGNPPNVAVPTHFYKLVVGETNGKSDVAAGAFVLPNDTISNEAKLRDFQVPVESLERSSGLKFFSKFQGKLNNLCNEVDCSIIVREFPKPKPLPGK